MLPDVMEVINAWGFIYKTCAFVWIKRYSKGNLYCGLGYWTRSGSEFCLLAFRGKMARFSASVLQVIESPVGKHSEKPEEIKCRITELLGNIPRIELFARKRTLGWDSWGLELDDENCICNHPKINHKSLEIEEWPCNKCPCNEYEQKNSPVLTPLRDILKRRRR